MTTGTRPAVLVARHIFPEVAARLEAHFEVEANDQPVDWSRDELLRRLQGKVGVFISGTEPIDAALLDACPDLRALCTMAVGYNNIDVAACTARGVLVTNAPDVLTETTADFGFALMMAAARRIAESEHFLRAGRWQRMVLRHVRRRRRARRHARHPGHGPHRPGHRAARCARLRHEGDLPQPLAGSRPRSKPSSVRATSSKDELLRQADHLVHRGAVFAFQPPCRRCGRAGADEADRDADQHRARRRRRRRGAGAGAAPSAASPRPDSTSSKASRQVHPELLGVPNVVLTPHIASATVPTRMAMAKLAADNLIAILGGKPALTPVNPEVLA